jgi:hypothetical protein
VIPYGVYFLARNTGLVSSSIDHDTHGFAFSIIGQWWMSMGKRT